MSLAFRLFSVGYTFSFTAFALFVLAVGILGRKIRWGYLAVFWGCSFAAPDAGYAMFFFALIVAGLFLMQFTAMYVAGQDRIKAQEETILQQQAHMALLK